MEYGNSGEIVDTHSRDPFCESLNVCYLLQCDCICFGTTYRLLRQEWFILGLIADCIFFCQTFHKQLMSHLSFLVSDFQALDPRTDIRYGCSSISVYPYQLHSHIEFQWFRQQTIALTTLVVCPNIFSVFACSIFLFTIKNRHQWFPFTWTLMSWKSYTSCKPVQW